MSGGAGEGNDPPPRTGLPDGPAAVRVLIDAPAVLEGKARWVLTTLGAAAGVRFEFGAADGEEGADAAAGDPVLAYAAGPVPGVPTIPASAEAARLLAGREPLPPQSFRRYPAAGAVPGELVGAFPVDEAGFAVPFDLIAAAFVLLGCWDEYTSGERDRHGRFPYAASVFATNDELRLDEPVCDAYAALLRDLVKGRTPVSEPGFLVALTHDVDGLRRWTGRGWLAWARRVVLACRRRELERARWEIGSALHYLRRDLPRGHDPAFTFASLLEGEDGLGVSSTFYVIASHGHRTDGNQPGDYRRRLPRALRLVTGAGREVGLHGNHRDARDLAALREDRAGLQRRLAATGAARGEQARPASAQVAGNRFHYLKYLYHESLPLLEAAGFRYDTSLAFAEHEGFRCGFSHPFRPWSMAEERPLRLLELPLAVMDSTLQERHYRHLPAEAAREATIAVLDTVRRSGGCAAVLWHHNRFHPYVGMGYDEVYWDVVRWVRENGGACAGAAEALERWRTSRPWVAVNAAGEAEEARAGDAAVEADDAPAGDAAVEVETTGADEAASATAPRTGAARPLAGRGAAAVLLPRARRPRVAHVSVVHRPDDPRIFERECRSLAAAGYDVTYMAPGAGSGFVEGVHLWGLPRRSRTTRWLSAAPILQALHALQPDVVHTHDPELLTLFPALRPFTPVLVYDMHEYLRDSIGAKYYIPSAARPAAAQTTAAVQRGLVSLGDGVAAVVAEQFDDLGAQPATRAVLPNYPRFARFRDAEPRPDMLAERRLKLAYVGSLTRNRGVQLMLDALLEVDDAVLYLGGVFSNPEFEAEARRIADRDLRGRVHFLGRVPPEDVPGLLAGADVVWVPSLATEQYQRPTVATKIFEGMAVGLAVLASDLPGRGDVVRAAGCGLTVEATVAGHVEGLRALAGDRDEVAAMGARARAAVEAGYSWEAIESRLIDFYAELLGRRRRTVQCRPAF